MKKFSWITALLLMTALPTLAAGSYQVTGKSGVMNFVSINPEQVNNEDIYRLAVAEVCAGKRICQVLYWVGDAPSSTPLNDTQANSKIVHWQQNLNTGLRRWLVKCDSSDLFANQRECI